MILFFKATKDLHTVNVLECFIAARITEGHATKSLLFYTLYCFLGNLLACTPLRFLQRYKLDCFTAITCGSSLFVKTSMLKKLIDELGVAAQIVDHIRDETKDVEANKA